MKAVARCFHTVFLSIPLLWYYGFWEQGAAANIFFFTVSL